MGPMAEATVRVPASTSNLGSGFDCIGFAIGMWLRASVSIAAGGAPLVIRRTGTLAELELPARDDLLYAGFLAACRMGGVDVPGALEFRVRSEIPAARGLGSSAAAFVAGAALASRALGLGLSPVGLAELCAVQEGHPDNAGPAALGGAVLGVRAPEGSARRYVYSALPVSRALGFVFAIPDFQVRTQDARAVLPRELPFGEAVRAAAKSAALVRGLATADRDLLAAGLDDVLHTPYRRGLIPGFEGVAMAARDAGAFGTTLSGSGSTLMAVVPRVRSPEVGEAMRRAWSGAGVRCDVRLVDRPVRGRLGAGGSE
jgi:homoserine kinase